MRKHQKQLLFFQLITGLTARDYAKNYLNNVNTVM